MPFPVDERFILDAESDLGGRLPESYRSSLQVQNGQEIEIGREHWYLYPVWDRSDKKRTSRTCNHIVLETRNARTWSGFPESAIALGEDDPGNRLILLPDPGDTERFGPILYRWDHETRVLEILADDISALI